MAVDFVGDFLTIIRNATMVSKPFVEVSYSKMRFAIAQILLQEGFVKDIDVKDIGIGKKSLTMRLKYAFGESVIHEIKRVSTPGLRVYKSIKDVNHVINGLGIAILTTPKGVISDKKARQYNVGGEIICTVW